MLKLFRGFVRPYLLFVLTIGFLTGCSFFITHYDATAYQYFTALKAYHLKFIDDFTMGDNKVWDEAAVKSACNSGDLRFREAMEYAAGKKDETRVHAIEYLHNVFNSQCQLSLKTKKLFGEAYATEKRKEVAANYDWAITGEISRVGAPEK